MHIINQRLLGILILILLALLVVIKRSATGSILEKPKPEPLLWLVNIFNLLFLLIINPLAAVIFIAEKGEGIDPSVVAVPGPWIFILEITGLVIYVAGFVLMGWALMRLGKNYQLGGSDPRGSDRMILDGPYAYIRHPMYSAALCIAFGLALLTESLACLAISVIYLLLILLLIPVEEESLLRAYGDGYSSYRMSVRKLIPHVF